MYIRRMDVKCKSIASAEKIQVHNDAKSSAASPPNEPIVVKQEHQKDDQAERRLNRDNQYGVAIASGGLQVSKYIAINIELN